MNGTLWEILGNRRFSWGWNHSIFSNTVYILLGKGTIPRQDLFFVYIIRCCLLDRHFIRNSKYIINSLFDLPEHLIFDIFQS